MLAEITPAGRALVEEATAALVGAEPRGLELERSKLRRLKSARAATLDGEDIALFANIELPEDVAEFIAKEGSKVTKKPVKDLGMPIGVTIGGLVRKDEGMLVSGNTQIEPGDSVMVFCHNINMKKIEKYFV